MTKYAIVVLYLAIFLLGCSTSKSDEVTEIVLEFDGGRGDFYRKYNLYHTIREKKEIRSILDGFARSEYVGSCPSLRPVLWEIDVFLVYSSGTQEQVFRVGTTTNSSEIILSESYDCYDNVELIDRILDIIPLERIKAHKGAMDQSTFESLFDG